MRDIGSRRWRARHENNLEIEDSKTLGCPECPFAKKTRMYKGKTHIRDMVPAPMMSQKEFFFFAGIVSMVGHLPSESTARELYSKP